MDFDILPNGKVLAANQEYDLKLELFVLSAFVIVFATLLKDAHFPDVIKEIAKKDLKTEKNDKDTRLVF